MAEEQRPQENDEEEPLVGSEKYLQDKTLAARKAYMNWKKKFQVGPAPPELSPEEKKVQEMADIIKTYRFVDQEKDEEHMEILWVDRPLFDVGMSCIILLNTIIIGVELDAEHKNTDGRHWAFILFEVCFCLCWISEIAVKMHYHGRWWPLMDGWNIFTCVIAFMAVLDGAILTPVGLSGSLRLLSLLRVLGLMRLLRIIKNYRSLKELRLVMQGLGGSLIMLMWTVVILLVFLYVCSVFTTSTIGRSDVFDDFKKMTNGWDHDDLFGSVGRSMWTLFQCMTRDSWSSDIARYVVVQQWYMAIFFIGFMLISTYGLLNLVVSVIVEQTLTAARANENKSKTKEERNRKEDLNELKEIFLLADEDGSGELDIHEFLHALEDEDIHWKLHSLDVQIDDAARLFTVMDGEGNRTLSMDEFIDGCTKLKGVARNRDLLAITAQADTLSRKMDDLGDELLASERMLYQLDEISVSITNRFHPSLKSSRKKIAKAVAGSAPVVPMHPEKPGSAIGVDLGSGNRPLMPKFPNLLK